MHHPYSPQLFYPCPKVRFCEILQMLHTTMISAMRSLQKCSKIFLTPADPLTTTCKSFFPWKKIRMRYAAGALEKMAFREARTVIFLKNRCARRCETPGFYTQDNCERRHTAMLTPWAPTVYACMCSRYACTCIGSYRCVYSLHGRERRCLHARLRLARARIAGVAMALAALCHHCLEDSVAALTLAVLDGILPRDVCLG